MGYKIQISEFRNALPDPDIVLGMIRDGLDVQSKIYSDMATGTRTINGYDISAPEAAFPNHREVALRGREYFWVFDTVSGTFEDRLTPGEYGEQKKCADPLRA